MRPLSLARLEEMLKHIGKLEFGDHLPTARPAASHRGHEKIAVWFDGSMVRWFDGSMVRWFDGSMVRWFEGPE
jgi:hypothetical protein